MSLGWTLLLAVVALVVIMTGSSVYFSWLLNKSLFSRLQVLDQIRTTRMPPNAWQRAYLRRGRKQGSVTQKAFERQQRKNLRRLRSLERFTKRTTLVESEQVREGVLRELSEIRQEWAAEEPTEKERL